MVDRTKITLADIYASGEAEGDSLVITAEGNVTASGVTGGSTGDPDTSLWHPDIPPASGYISGSTEDDEFNDLSFDTGLWTEFDVAGTQTVVEDEYGVHMSTTSVNHLQGIFQAVPAGTNWSFTTYIGPMWDRTSNHRAGILLIEDIGNLSTSACAVFANFRGGAGWGWQFIRHSDYDSWVNDDYNNVGTTGRPMTGQYLRFRRDGTNWYCDWSENGKAWMSNQHTQAKTWTVEGIGVGHKFDHSSLVARFPFARFKDDSGKDQVLYGDRIKIWRV